MLISNNQNKRSRVLMVQKDRLVDYPQQIITRFYMYSRWCRNYELLAVSTNFWLPRCWRFFSRTNQPTRFALKKMFVFFQRQLAAGGFFSTGGRNPVCLMSRPIVYRVLVIPTAETKYVSETNPGHVYYIVWPGWQSFIRIPIDQACISVSWHVIRVLNTAM